MNRRPDANLEFALLADGVAKERVYEVLSTQEGLDRGKLDTSGPLRRAPRGRRGGHEHGLTPRCSRGSPS